MRLLVHALAALVLLLPAVVVSRPLGTACKGIECGFSNPLVPTEEVEDEESEPDPVAEALLARANTFKDALDQLDGWLSLIKDSGKLPEGAFEAMKQDRDSIKYMWEMKVLLPLKQMAPFTKDVRTSKYQATLLNSRIMMKSLQAEYMRFKRKLQSAARVTGVNLFANYKFLPKRPPPSRYSPRRQKYFRDLLERVRSYGRKKRSIGRERRYYEPGGDNKRRNGPPSMSPGRTKQLFNFLNMADSSDGSVEEDFIEGMEEPTETALSSNSFREKRDTDDRRVRRGLGVEYFLDMIDRVKALAPTVNPNFFETEPEPEPDALGEALYAKAQTFRDALETVDDMILQLRLSRTIMESSLLSFYTVRNHLYNMWQTKVMAPLRKLAPFIEHVQSKKYQTTLSTTRAAMAELQVEYSSFRDKLEVTARSLGVDLFPGNTIVAAPLGYSEDTNKKYLELLEMAKTFGRKKRSNDSDVEEVESTEQQEEAANSLD